MRVSLRIAIVLVVTAAAAVPASAKDRSATKLPPSAAGFAERDARAQDERLAADVMKVVQAHVRNAAVPSPERETIAAMAAVVGERCQEAAGEFPVRKHTFVPGQRVFSDRVNLMLVGDGRARDFEAISAETVYGQIRDQVDKGRFSKDRFPKLDSPFREFAGRIGESEDWGKVPLSLPPQAWPRLLPLRVAFDTRAAVDAALVPIKDDKARVLRVCTRALTMLLNGADEHLDPAAAMVLTLETINGMAKTAPMLTPIAAPTEAMRQAQHDVIKIGPR